MKLRFAALVLALLAVPARSPAAEPAEKRLPTERLSYLSATGGAVARYPLVPDAPVRNVILFIGDGMGIGHLTAARLHACGPDGRLQIERMPVTGLLTTHSADSIVTKSDAAGTALATGRKTKNGMVGVDPGGNPLRSLLEAARDAGLATGLVTTTLITDATPAAFGAHVRSRGDHAAIAQQLLENRVNVLLGDGRGFFIPRSAAGSARRDDDDLLARARAQGYAVVETQQGLAAAEGGRVLGLFPVPGPPLVDRARKALEILGRNERGFFLMVEHEGTDEWSHKNRISEVVRALRQLDEAVAAGLEFAARDGRTLVVVTADHETGGLEIEAPEGGGGDAEITWTTSGHTGQPVPLFAYGPHASRLTGLRDNTEVPAILAGILGVPFPGPAR